MRVNELLARKCDFLFVCLLFRATPEVYGISQARGLIGTSAASLHHSPTATATPDLSRVCDLHHSSRQHWILNPLISDARARTRNLMVPRQIH